MFTTLASKGADTLGKTYLYAGVAPALIFLLGGWGLWSGIDVLNAKLSLLDNGKADSLVQLGGQILLTGFILMVIRERLVSWMEELPGSWLSPLRNVLVSRAMRKRSAIRTQCEVLDAYYTSVRMLREGCLGAGYVPPSITLPSWEEIVSLDGMARAARTGSAPGLPLRKAMLIAQSITLIDSYALKGTGDLWYEQCLMERERWAIWAKVEANNRLLQEIEGTILREQGRMKSELRAFPESAWIKPTKLGNCLSMLQDYASKRYGVDTSLLWERIWWSLPETCKKEISDTRLLIESIIVLAFVWGALAVLGIVMVASSYSMPFLGFNPLPMPRDPRSTLGASAVLFSLAYFTYLLVLVPGSVFTNQVMSLIDMYRLSALKQLGMPPKTVYEEGATMTALDGFWRDGISLGDWRTLRPPEKKSD